MDRLLIEGCFLIVSAGLNEDESNEVKDWKSQYRNNTTMLKWIDDFVHREIKSRDDILKKKLESMGWPYYELLGIYGGIPELSYMVDLTNNGKNSKQKIDVLCDSLISFVGRKLIQDAVIGRYGKQESYVYCGKRGLSNMFHNELVKHLEGFGEKGQSEMRHERKIMNPEKDFSRFNNDYDWGRKKPGRGF